MAKNRAKNLILLIKFDTLLIIYTIFESQSLKKKYDRGEMGVKTEQIDFFSINKNNFLGILMLSLQSEVLFFKKILLLCKQHPFTFFIPILPLLYNFLGGWDAKIVCVIERATNFTNNFKISKITFSFYENKNQFTKFLPPFHSYYIIFLNFSKCNN